jgi:RHS repeat-associated protein
LNTVTDPASRVTTVSVDSNDNLTRVTDPDSAVTQYGYGTPANHEITTETNPNGKTATAHYNSFGQMTSETLFDGTSTTSVSSEQSQGLLAPGGEGALPTALQGSVTDPDSNKTALTFNAGGHPTAIGDPATGLSTGFIYNDQGFPTAVTDLRGNTVTYTYDSAGSVASITRIDDGSGSDVTETIGYGVDEVPTSITDFNGKTTAFTLDSHGNVLTEQDPVSGHQETWTYNSAGQVLTFTDGNNHTTTYAYDSDGRLKTVTDGNNHTTTYTYDNAGNMATVTDANGHTTSYVYDSADRLVSETEPSGGGTTSYTYDGDNNLLTVTDPDHNTTTYTYNAEDEVATETSPTGGVTTYTYDGQGNLTQVVDPDGHTIQYKYDADNRETTETWVNPQGGTAIDVFTTTYDNNGNVASISDNYSKYAFTYDSNNRVLTVDNSGTPNVPHVVVTYTYDPNGNRTILSDSLGGSVTYGYDALNELTSETQSGTGVDPALVDFGYDNAGYMNRLTRYSDTSATNDVLATVYSHDAANNLVGVSHQTPSSFVVASYAYTLDPANRLTQEVHTWGTGASSDTLGFTYTNNGQLTGVTHSNSSFANESFSYSANGNRNMTGYSTGTGNELTSDGTYNYTYDNNNNRLTRTSIATGNETIYTYDFRNRLVEVDQVVGGARSVLAQYTYDALNRRIGVSEGGATTWMMYDGTSAVPLLDFNGAGSLTARYLGGPTAVGVDGVLARDTPSGGMAWYLPSRLGTVGDIVNNSGTVIDHIDYSAFGQVLGETEASTGDRFKYAGMQYDAVTGLYYDQARWYDPAAGRFITTDPTGFGGGDSNIYRYVGNDSTGTFDPTGLGYNPGSSLYEPVGYIDANLSLPFLYGIFAAGIQFGRSSYNSWWRPHPYLGIQAPGVALSWAPAQYVSPGWNGGVSLSPLSEGPQLQIGKSKKGWFCEVGVGASILPFIGPGIWYVW